MALHFYMNGTTGAQDGVEISNGDLSNPLVFDGFYAASGVTLSKTKTIHIRADAGETWHFVFVDLMITDKTDTSSFRRFVFPSQPIGHTLADIPSFCTSSGSWPSEITYTSVITYIGFSIVGDTNLPISITAKIIGGETSPNSNVKLVVCGGIKE